MASFIKMFVPKPSKIYVTEFGYSKHEKSKTVGPWTRKIYILHLVVKGYCEFSGFRAEAGQAFFIAKDRLHSFTISSDYEHYWIGFSGDEVEKVLNTFNVVNNTHHLFGVENFDYAKNLFDDALVRLESKDLQNGDSLVLSLLNSMLPLLNQVKAQEMPYRMSYAESAKIFIRINYMRPIKMIDIANEMHISEKHMYRVFYNRFKISPQHFLLKTRMDVAEELLRENKISIKEIALTVGYTSIPSFSKAFLKYFGESPSTYRIKRSNNE